MAPKDNAEVRTQTAQGAHYGNASLRAADWHVSHSSSAGPILLHIPTSRLFSISPALADHLTADRGTDVGAAPRGRPMAEGDAARPLRRGAASRSRKSRGLKTTRPIEPAAGAAADLSAALAELESLCRPQPSAQSSQPAAAGDDTCATSTERVILSEAPAEGTARSEGSAPGERASSPRWANLTLFVTDQCNLRCAYCFESYRSLRETGRTITRETAAAALDFFFDRLYPDAEVYDLHLFGGEPLLAWDMVEWITLEARRRAEAKLVGQASRLPTTQSVDPSADSGNGPNRHPALSMSISTNAIGLTARQAAFLREHEFDVSVSFDGPAEVHDQFRKFPNGRGSFAAVQKGLAHLNVAQPPSAVSLAPPPAPRSPGEVGSAVSLRQPPYTSVAGRLHRGNTDVLKSFLAAYEATGGKQGIAFTLARLSPDHPLRLREDDVDQILDSYRKLVDFIIERTAKGEYGHLAALMIGNDYVGRFIPRLKARSRGSRRCGAGMSLFVVSTDGGVYPCRSLVGIDEYRLGDVEHGIERKRHEPWLHLTIEERHDCKTCWARYLCGGGCYAQAAIACGTPARPNPVECKYTRGLVELAMEFIARLSTEAPGKLDDALADVVFGLPEKHRVFVPAALQGQLGAPRIETVEIEPRVVAPGGTVRGRVAVRARRPLAAVTIYDSGFGSRALAPVSEPSDHWPQTLWFSGEERLDGNAPSGRYVVWAVALDETGALARAQTHMEVRRQDTPSSRASADPKSVIGAPSV